MRKVAAPGYVTEVYLQVDSSDRFLAEKVYNLEYGAEDLLDRVYRAWNPCRRCSADLVGTGRDTSYWVCFVVDGVSQRVV
jgi:hypothetical protein